MPAEENHAQIIAVDLGDISPEKAAALQHAINWGIADAYRKGWKDARDPKSDGKTPPTHGQIIAFLHLKEQEAAHAQGLCACQQEKPES